MNNLRKEFEKLDEIADILEEERVYFDDDLGYYNIPNNSCADQYINGAWYAYKECKK